MKEKGRTRWGRDRQEWRIGWSNKKMEMNKREVEGTGRERRTSIYER